VARGRPCLAGAVPPPSDLPRPRSPRPVAALVAALVAIASLAVVVLAGYLWRERALAQGSGPLGEGRLRQDTRFTADDGARTVVRYSISLPDDYYSTDRRYPVLYALHGKTQNNASFMDEALSLRRAMAAGALEPSIIVTPDSYSTGRWENRETGPAEDNFIKYLIPYVEQNYRVEPGPSHRLLVGFSMGGHGALRFGLKYPQMFAAVWSVDGAMAPAEDYLSYVRGKTSDDFRITVVGGQLNGERVRKVVDALKENGVDLPYVHQDLKHDFVTFVDEDKRAGWPAMRYLQRGLGAG
jgi:poly(3-hydroxybutyrate) depolymerase